MLYEVTRSNGLPLIFKVADKKDKKSEYEIVIHIILLKNGITDDRYDRKISIEEFDLKFFETLIKLNNEKLDEFEKSRNYLGRVKWWSSYQF